MTLKYNLLPQSCIHAYHCLQGTRVQLYVQVLGRLHNVWVRLSKDKNIESGGANKMLVSAWPAQNIHVH